MTKRYQEGTMSHDVKAPPGWKYDQKAGEWKFYVDGDDQPVIKASVRLKAVMVRADVKDQLPGALIEKQKLVGLALLRGEVRGDHV
jgi:hypothetical protein